jgi:hypothetical protein
MPWGDDWDPAVVAKYRATWQFKAALEIISPASQHRASCERDIIEALMSIEAWRKISSTRSPTEQRKLLLKLAKTLRAGISLAHQIGPWDLWDWDPRRYGELLGEGLLEDLPSQTGDQESWDVVGDLERYHKEIEAAADWIAKNAVTKGAPRYNNVRAAAVAKAQLLLREYSKEPGRSREGPWHELARVLFGNTDADLFDYIEQFPPEEVS